MRIRPARPGVERSAGPRVAEIKVKHHARQFGKSKYGISRVYKVLLDLMVIKTIASFAARPLQWFSILAAPLLLLGSIIVATIGAIILIVVLRIIKRA